jgi:hypothetical protein
MPESIAKYVDRAAVLKGIRELAQARPGVYDAPGTGCVNVTHDDDGNRVPSCIVGSFFSDLVGVDNVPPTGTSDHVIEDLTIAGFVSVTPEAAFLLKTAQILQDTREVSWEVIHLVLAEIGLSASVYKRASQ